MKGGDLEKIPDNYVSVQANMTPLSRYTAEDVWDILDELRDEGVEIREPLLTLGCCIGLECLQFRKMFSGRIVGVDIVPKFIYEARKEAKLQRAHVEFKVADIHELPFEDREFDTVYSRGTLEHCYNLERAVAEIKRVTSRLIVLTADLVPEDHKYVGKADYAFSDDTAEWKALFAGTDWKLRHEWEVEGLREYQLLHMAWERV